MIFFKKTTCGGHQSVRLGRALYAKNSPRYRPPSLVRSVLPAPSLRFRKILSKKIAQPFAKVDSHIDPKLCRAATIAQERARAHSHCLCWRFVKEALVAAGVVKSRPQTPLAKQAGQELVNNYGFKKLPVSNPYEAPVGAVLVYDGGRAAGHVEIRTQDGFVSDFRSKTPSRRPLIGVFAKA